MSLFCFCIYNISASSCNVFRVGGSVMVQIGPIIRNISSFWLSLRHSVRVTTLLSEVGEVLGTRGNPPQHAAFVSPPLTLLQIRATGWGGISVWGTAMVTCYVRHAPLHSPPAPLSPLAVAPPDTGTMWSFLPVGGCTFHLLQTKSQSCLPPAAA